MSSESGAGGRSDPRGGRQLPQQQPAPPPGVAPVAGGAAAAMRARQEAAAGAALYDRGQYRAALQRLAAAVALRPGEADYRYMLACAADRAGQPRLIEPQLLEALRLNPKYAPARTALANWYCRAGRLDLALEQSAAALALDRNDPKAVLARATVLWTAGQAKTAWELIDPLAAAGSTDRWLAQLYARLAPSVGREEQALTLLARALQAPNLPPGPAGRGLLHFAASTLLDRMGRYDDAFEQARLGNESARAAAPRAHDPAAHSQRVSRLIEYFSPRRLRSLPRATHGSRRPVFIVGVPRSGTSLVEQILASHPQVHGGGELPTLSTLTRTAAHAEWAEEGETYPDCLDSLSPRGADRLAGEYLSVIDGLGADATHVTDKMPANYLNLEAVELLLPGSRVIHCVRDPLDTCLSCYLSNFADGNEFSLDLAHLGAYYRDYRRLMDHWRRALTVPVLDVRYEDLVLDTGPQVRRLLDFLDLPWDDRCLRFHENKRLVKTASEDQVRRPIYTSSIGRWKHYEKHLSPLIAALGTPPRDAPA